MRPKKFDNKQINILSPFPVIALWQEGSQGGWGFYDRDAASGAWTERPLVFAAHARVYAEAIAGEPSAIHYDPDTHVFELRFDGRSDRAPHVVHVPEEPYFPARSLK